MKVQQLLERHSLRWLLDKYSIESSAKVGDYKFSLSYTQTASPNEVSSECRGLILCTSKFRPLTEKQIELKAPIGATTILARPFDRFFNVGQPGAARIDLVESSTKIYEKLDGTLVNVYFDIHQQRWHVATRNVPEANTPIYSLQEKLTFRQLFERCLQELGVLNSYFPTFDAWASLLSKDFTYIFELTSPYNRVVVAYPHMGLHLLGIRNNKTGKEVDISIFSEIKFNNIPICPSYTFNSMEKLEEFIGSKPATEQEGIVICDSSFQRVKIKSVAYVYAHRTKSSAESSPRSLLALLITGALDDIIPLLDNRSKVYAATLQERFTALTTKYNHIYSSIVETMANPEDRKEFACKAAKTGLEMAPLMSMYSKKANNFTDFIKQNEVSPDTWKPSFLDTLLRQLSD